MFSPLVYDRYDLLPSNVNNRYDVSALVTQMVKCDHFEYLILNTSHDQVSFGRKIYGHDLQPKQLQTKIYEFMNHIKRSKRGYYLEADANRICIILGLVNNRYECMWIDGRFFKDTYEILILRLLLQYTHEYHEDAFRDVYYEIKEMRHEFHSQLHMMQRDLKLVTQYNLHKMDYEHSCMYESYVKHEYKRYKYINKCRLCLWYPDFSVEQLKGNPKYSRNMDKLKDHCKSHKHRISCMIFVSAYMRQNGMCDDIITFMLTEVYQHDYIDLF